MPKLTTDQVTHQVQLMVANWLGSTLICFAMLSSRRETDYRDKRLNLRLG